MDAEPVVTSITISDGAIVEAGTGKLSLIGCFHVLRLRRFPFLYPRFFATVSLTNLPVGSTELALTVRVEIEATGHVLSSAGGQVKVEVQKSDETPVFDPRKMSVDIPIPVTNISFPAPGVYSLLVLGNNEPLLRRNLIVDHQKPAAQKPPDRQP